MKSTKHIWGTPQQNPSRSGHVAPKAPIVSLDQPGRQRPANLMALYGISHSTLYNWIRDEKIPPGHKAGRIRYWHNWEIKADFDQLVQLEGVPSVTQADDVSERLIVDGVLKSQSTLDDCPPSKTLVPSAQAKAVGAAAGATPNQVQES